ncbi:hypothetical protein ABPG74_007423 [Tetrahymena malaccensis]
MNLSNAGISDNKINGIFKKFQNKDKQIAIDLNLSDNVLTDNGVLQLVSGIKTLFPNLTQLSISLSNNQIGDKGLANIFQMIKQVPNLSQVSLFLSGNNFSKNGFKCIEDMKNVNSLQKLHLGFNNFQQSIELIKSLIKFIESNRDLADFGLYIDHSEVGNQGTSYICKLLQSFNQLSSLTLHVDQNCLTNNGILNIVRSIVQNKQIRHLNLNLCNQAVNNNNYTQNFYLDSYYNVISQECVLDIINIIGAHLKLDELALYIKHYNKITYTNFQKEGYDALLNNINNNLIELQKSINQNLKQIKQLKVIA